MTKKALLADLKAAGYRTKATHQPEEGAPVVEVVLERPDQELSEKAQAVAREHGYLVEFVRP